MAISSIARLQELKKSAPQEPDYLDLPDNLIPYQRETVVVQAPDYTPQASMTVDEARSMLRDEIDNYLDTDLPDYMLLVRASPGVGKTHAAVRTAERLATEGKRVMYAGPRHDFFQDIMKITTQPQDWYEWLPRDEETCDYDDPMRRWINKGYKAMDFCSKVCGWRHVNEGCVWHQQKKRTEKVMYCQHAHIMAHPLKFHVVIGDENPFSTFLHEWVIRPADVMPMGMDHKEDFTHMLQELAGIVALSTNNKLPLMGPQLLEALGGAQRVLEACEAFRISPDALAMSPDIHDADDADRVSPFHLPALVNLFLREAAACLSGGKYLERIIVVSGELRLLLRKHISEELPPHIIWLDATGEPHIYEELFKRPVRVIDATPTLKGAIYQVTNRANGKGAVEGEKPQVVRWRDQLLEQIDAIRQSKDYVKPAVITFQGIEKELSDIDSMHFYASRGSNSFIDVDCMIIAGTPQPSLTEVEKVAKMIYFDRMEAFDTTWADKMVAYNYVNEDTDTGLGRDVGGYWNDPDMSAMLWSVREAEIIQAAHRSRPISRECDIWLLTNLPVKELPPTELLTIHQLFGADKNFDTKINPFLYRKIMMALEALFANQARIHLEEGRIEHVTLTQLVDAVGISRPTVKKIWDSLDFTTVHKVTVKSAKGGRPCDGLVLKDVLGY